MFICADVNLSSRWYLGADGEKSCEWRKPTDIQLGELEAGDGADGVSMWTNQDPVLTAAMRTGCRSAWGPQHWTCDVLHSDGSVGSFTTKVLVFGCYQRLEQQTGGRTLRDTGTGYNVQQLKETRITCWISFLCLSTSSQCDDMPVTPGPAELLTSNTSVWTPHWTSTLLKLSF